MYEGETEPIPRVTGRDHEDEAPEPVPSSGHHHHHHGPAAPASKRVRNLIAILLVPFAVAAVAGTILLFPFGGTPDFANNAGTPVHGTITAATIGGCSSDVEVGAPEGEECLVVTVLMSDGEAPGQEIRAYVPQEPSTPRFAVDDEVVLSYGGGDPTDGNSYLLVDFQRDVPLVLLAALFAAAVLLLGRWQGLKALAALGLSFMVLLFFVLPAIVAGESPLLVAVFGSGVIMFVVLYLTHGLSARTSTAVLGTMVSLALIGVLGALWSAFASLTGLDEDTAQLVGTLGHAIDTRGLLLAGVVIGALGVLDDVTVTQTSAVWELRAANPNLSRRQLYGSALRIGRDHVASAVNTLVMAYAGAALPVLLYSSISGVGITNILSSQTIAQEIVRTLVGSIGLVAAVPVTTALAAAVAATEPRTPEPATDSGRTGAQPTRTRSRDVRPDRTRNRDDRPSRSTRTSGRDDRSSQLHKARGDRGQPNTVRERDDRPSQPDRTRDDQPGRPNKARDDRPGQPNRPRDRPRAEQPRRARERDDRPSQPNRPRGDRAGQARRTHDDQPERGRDEHPRERGAQPGKARPDRPSRARPRDPENPRPRRRPDPPDS